MKLTQFSKKFGPGLLYAAAAIGVSHLVQSTRAGADFGFQLLWAVILANLLKYPFFLAGPQYTALTGKSLLSGYKKIGNWTLIIFFMMTLGTMFTVQAAVTLVTGGLLNQFFNLAIDVRLTSSILLILTAMMLILGRYNILDNLIKVIIIVLTITTIITVIFAFFGTFEQFAPPTIFDFKNSEHIFFLIALIGWMPAPLDVPIWHGLWSMAKNIEEKKSTTLKEAVLDFNVGYITTAFLAVCFLALGALVMYRSGLELSSSATIFASQLVKMYTHSLGKWSYPIISIAAFTTMFSTTLTCLDAFARIMREGIFVYSENSKHHSPIWYNFWIMITITGSIFIYYFFLQNMKSLVDMATTLSFIVAPFYAILNFKVMQSSEVSSQLKIHLWNKVLSFSGIIFLVGFTIYFLWLKVN